MLGFDVFYSVEICIADFSLISWRLGREMLLNHFFNNFWDHLEGVLDVLLFLLSNQPLVQRALESISSFLTRPCPGSTSCSFTFPRLPFTSSYILGNRRLFQPFLEACFAHSLSSTSMQANASRSSSNRWSCRRPLLVNVRFRCEPFNHMMTFNDMVRWSKNKMRSLLLWQLFAKALYFAAS